MMNIVKALKTIPPEFDARGQVVFVPMMEGMPFMEAWWNSFTLDPAGDDIVRAPVGEDVVLEVLDGRIISDREVVYTKATDITEFMKSQGQVGLLAEPATKAVAEIAEDGKAILYRGRLDSQPTICRGDLQRCAMHNLGVIMRSNALRRLGLTEES